jgi:competence protein ComEA
VIRKAVAITLGGIALAAIGAISMAHQTGRTPGVQALTASVPGIEPLEWLANGPTSDGFPSRSAGASTEPARSTTNIGVPATTTAVSPTHDATSPNPAPGAGQGGILPDGRVVLNLATSTDLQTLPGIGQKRAESILALRERLGGFRKLSDLLRVKGIGVKSLRKLEPKVSLNPPAPQPSPAETSPSGAQPYKPPNHPKH